MRSGGLAIALMLAAACGLSEKSQLAPEVTEDIARICHAEERSGALAEHPSSRSLHVASWLGANLRTQEARDLLARVGKAAPDEKRELLLAEAKRAGLADCPTARTWAGSP